MDISMLNEEQIEAVTSEHNKILCLAGAGTGKTQTLIGRISNLIDSGKCRSGDILALTFTNAGAFEMRERYKRLASSTNETPEFRTFHSFCYSLISKDIAVRHKLGYKNIPKICTNAEMEEIHRSVMLKCSIKLSPNKLNSSATILSPKEKFQYDLFRQALKQKLCTENVITFDYLCEGICKLFCANDSTITKYKDKYKYIFVDEFQDTDPLQWEFVQSFYNSDLFIVGDALQALYGFRNADSSIIKSLAADPKWKTIKLYRNYRSTSNICEFANKMSTYADDKYRIEIKSNRTGCEVRQDSSMSGNQFKAISVELLDKLLYDIQTQTGSLAILCRQNKEVHEIVEYLKENEVDVSTANPNEEARSVFTAARDNEYLVSWLSSLLNAEDYANWLRVITLNNVEDVSDKLTLFKEFTQNNKTVSYQWSRILSIRHTIRDKSKSAITRCVDILRILGIKKHMIVIDTQGLDDDDEIIQNIADYIDKAIGATTDTEVYVGTIHSSKGLEYDNVILVNVDGYTFPLDKEENLNCYYVGITRARNWLKVYWPV